MTYTATREQLELAAKALGLAIVGPVERYIAQPDKMHEGGFIVRNERGGDSAWHPGSSQADSASMGDDLEIGIRYSGYFVFAFAYREGQQYPKTARHDGTIEGRRAAVREARLLVAVEIGRGMK